MDRWSWARHVTRRSAWGATRSWRAHRRRSRPKIRGNWRTSSRQGPSLKGIERITVQALDGEAATVEAAPETEAPSAGLAALRAFAATVAERVGSSLLSTVETWPVGFLADRVAEASDDADLCARALVELDTARRAALVAAAVLP